MSSFADRDRGVIGANDQAASRLSRRPRRADPRALPAVVAVAALALLVAGCGGGKPRASVANLRSTTTTTDTTPTGSAGEGAASSGSGSQTNLGGGFGGRFALAGGGVEQLTKFASCMRTNGVPNFPDPDAQGQISFSSADGVDPGSAQFQRAQQACQKLLPNGGQLSSAQQGKGRTQALAFSACMRSHGEPNFPDPEFGSGGRVSISINQSSGIDPRSSQFQASQKACQKDLPGAPTVAPPGAVRPQGSGVDSSGG
jgi:hypothetical protein